MDVSLKGTAVLLSCSIPEEMEGRFASQANFTFLTSLVRQVLGADGLLVSGGDPTVVSLLHSVGQTVKAGGVVLFQSESYRNTLQPLVGDRAVFQEVVWVPDQGDVKASLHEMRRRMTRRANAGVFVGGRTHKFLGYKAGIREEYELFLEQNPDGPAYLVGLLGGAARELIREGAREPNSLAPPERELLHKSDNVDTLVCLVFGDLLRRGRRPAPAPPEVLSAPAGPARGGWRTRSGETVPTPSARQTAVTVRFTYATGVKRPFLSAARLTGGWDAARRPSDHWTTLPMQPIVGPDGCPAFQAEVSFPVRHVGRTFRWGVLIDGPTGSNLWGIPTEVRDTTSRERHRSFDLPPPRDDRAPREESYYLSHSYRLGAQKYACHPGRPPALRAGVWAPSARDVRLVFGAFRDVEDPGRAPAVGPLPIGRIGGGYIADDPPGHGADPGLVPFPMARDGAFWFTDPEDERLADFAALDHRPYMFLVARDDGSASYRTDLFSRCQAGRGRTDPGGRPFEGRVADLDARVSCSVVVDPDRVTREFDSPVWPEPAEAYIPARDFWAHEFDPARPVPRRVEDLVIYELHVGALGGPDKAGPGDFGDALKFLDYLVNLGINAVELMPLAETGLGGESWGFGSTHHFAIEFRAGGRDQFKHFVRECHRRGIAVLLDVVYNHFAADAGRAEWMFDSSLPERNIYYWYEGRPSDYPTPDGGYVDNMTTGFAPRTHEEMVRALFISSAVALAEEFHVDGFRFEFIDALYRLNVRHADGVPVPSANAFGAKLLREWCRTLKLIRPEIMLVAEDVGGWDMVKAAPDRGGLGFDATWYPAFHHHLVGAPGRGPGWAALLTRAGLGGDEPLDLDAFAAALRASAGGCVVFHQSHADAGNAPGSGRTMSLAVNGAPLVGATRRWAERRSRLVAGLSLLSPGTPMFLMGEEVAASRPYTVDRWLAEREDLPAESQGAGRMMFRFYAEVIRLRLAHPALRSRHVAIVHIHDANRVLVFHRWSGAEHFLVCASFNNLAFANGYDIHDPSLPDGEWKEVFNSDDERFGGDGIGVDGGAVGCWAGRLRLVLPAAGLAVLRKP